MSYFEEVALGGPLQLFDTFREQFGFVPAVFRGQTLLPRLIEAESVLLAPTLFQDNALVRAQKELVLLALAASRGNSYCFALHYQMLRLLGAPERRIDRVLAGFQRADLAPANLALITLTQMLGTINPLISEADVNDARSHGLTDETLLEAVLTAALSRLLCTLSTGVGAVPDFASRMPAPPAVPPVQDGRLTGEIEQPGFYIHAPELSPADSAPFAFLRNQFGFVPSVFRAQTARPDVLEAEVFAIRRILLSEEALSRRQKEHILRGCDPSQADLTGDERALLNFAAQLSDDPPGLSRKDIQELTACGFTGQQILETVAITAFAGFFRVLQTGLGAVPDFVAPRRFPSDQMKGDAENVHLSALGERHYEVTTPVDPDRDCVASVQRGDLHGFEDLMNRHRQRIYRILVGILGDPDEALDAMQDTFLKAFQHLPKFEGRSKFSTWLGSIATNTGLERLRRRRPMESLDESGPDVEGFRPREVQAWTDDPEQSHSRSEIRALVENGVMALPAKYRVVLMLRDIEQLTIEETASALGLGVPAIKSRLLRARLMLRETLAPHFISSGARPRVAGGNL